MDTNDFTSTMSKADALSVLSRAEVERRGRWGSTWRAFAVPVGILVVLLPLYAVNAERLPSNGVSARVTGRLLLLGEIVFVRHFFGFAWRCGELVRSSRAGSGFLKANKFLLGVFAAVSMVVLIEKGVLWYSLGDDDRYPVALTLVGPAWVHWGVGGLGALVMGGLAWLSSPGFWWRRDEAGSIQPRRLRRWLEKRLFPQKVKWVERRTQIDDRWRSVLLPDPEPTQQPGRGGTIICCSGGGMRSASFCLGGLQELQERNIYQQADAVVGVSGGGYVAAAMHVLRWQPQDENEDGKNRPWPSLDQPPFAEGTPELGWLRRHSRFLFDSPRMATLAAMSIVLGMLVNLFWAALMLGVTAWWLGWVFAVSKGLVMDKGQMVGGRYTNGWAWLKWTWGLPLAGLAIFFLQRVAARLRGFNAKVAGAWRSLSVVVVWAGLIAVGLLLVLPGLMAGLYNFGRASGSPWDTLITAFGLSDGNVAARSSTLSLGAVAAATLAVVRVTLKKAGGSGGTKVPGFLSKIVDGLRRQVLPWLALIVIVASALLTLMIWTAVFWKTPNTHNWWFVGIALVVSVLLNATIDVNWTSLHHFYRERLSYAFLQQRIGSQSRPLPYRRSVRFSQSTPPHGHGPRLVTCAVANISDVEYVPADRRATPFIFDSECIGMVDRSLPSGKRMTAPLYEFAADFRMRDATIPAAMAMSGAAFSPLVGREHRRIAPYRLIMALANARLGVWLPNPIWADQSLQTARMIKLRRSELVMRAWPELPPTEQQFITEYDLGPKDRRWLARVLAGETPGRWDLGQVHKLVTRRRPQALAAWQSLTPKERQEFVEQDALTGGAGWRWLKTESWREPEELLHGQRKLLDARASKWRSVVEYVRYVFNQPGPIRLAKEGFGRPSLMDRRLYITDGGHYDNLGLIEALRRRPEVIYVLDASNDAADSFDALGEAIATARIDLDCELSLDPAGMMTDESGAAKVAWQSGVATFPVEAREPRQWQTIVHFVKAVKIKALPLDVEVYARKHPDFPRTSTGNQFYGEFDLEAYRQLGRVATAGLLDSLESTRLSTHAAS